jgi:hypothetical protein
VIILNDNLQNLEAALNKQITDDEGQLEQEETTFFEEPATQEEKQVDYSTQEVNPADEEVQEPKPETESEETQLVEDEEGKKYIPEKRFKEIYAKAKENERKVRELEKAIAAQIRQPAQEAVPQSKADALEVELLFSKYPQFDPTNSEYDQDVDDLAADLYVAGKARTKIEAAKMALEKVKVLSSKSLSIKDEARTIKKMMAESVTSKGGARTEAQPDLDKMSVTELETYMKAKGEWLE